MSGAKIRTNPETTKFFGHKKHGASSQRPVHERDTNFINSYMRDSDMLPSPLASSPKHQSVPEESDADSDQQG